MYCLYKCHDYNIIIIIASQYYCSKLDQLIHALAHILLQYKMTSMTVIVAARMTARRTNITTSPAMSPSLFAGSRTGGREVQG